jgi:hypothetical protein
MRENGVEMSGTLNRGKMKGRPGNIFFDNRTNAHRRAFFGGTLVENLGPDRKETETLAGFGIGPKQKRCLWESVGYPETRSRGHCVRKARVKRVFLSKLNTVTTNELFVISGITIKRHYMMSSNFNSIKCVFRAKSPIRTVFYKAIPKITVGWGHRANPERHGIKRLAGVYGGRSGGIANPNTNDNARSNEDGSA